MSLESPDYTENQNKIPENTGQTDFPEIEEYFGDDEPKKNSILNVLKSGNMGDVFKKILESVKSDGCLSGLLECENDEKKIKEVILANLPEGYSYDVSTGNVVEGQKIKTDNFNGAVIRDQSEAEAVQNEAEAVQNEAEAVQNEADALNNREKIERAREIAMVARQELLASHPDVDKKTKEKAELAKQQLPEETKNKLIEKGYDESFINDYILLRVTANEVKNDSSFDRNAVAQFENKVNELSTFDVFLKSIDNACNIPDTSLSSFSSENISQTRTELFNEDKRVGNESLKRLRDSNMESRDYSEVFHEMGDDEIIAKYGKFLEGGLREFCDKYQNDLELRNKINSLNNPQTDEEKQLLLNYQNMLSELKRIKEDMETKTKNLMEEMCIISQIKGMSMCIGQESGNDFNLNKTNEIINDNGVLTLNGHIDGVDFSVRHNTNNSDAHLQTNSKFEISSDKNTFIFGSEGQYVDSPFILPSQEEIFSVIADVVKSNDINNSDDWDSYVEKLQNGIIGKMDTVYKDAEFAHHYITNKVRGEKIINNSLSLIKRIKPSIDLTKPINQDSNPKLHSFLKIINFNIENSTTEEKNKLNEIFTKIEEIKNTYRNNPSDTFKYPAVIENFLKNNKWLTDGNEYEKLGLISDLFYYYSKNSKDTRTNQEGSEGTASKMVINDLYRDLIEFASSGKSEVAKKREYEENMKKAKENEKKHDEEKKKEVIAADTELDEELAEIND